MICVSSLRVVCVVFVVVWLIVLLWLTLFYCLVVGFACRRV